MLEQIKVNIEVKYTCPCCGREDIIDFPVNSNQLKWIEAVRGGFSSAIQHNILVSGWVEANDGSNVLLCSFECLKQWNNKLEGIGE